MTEELQKVSSDFALEITATDAARHQQRTLQKVALVIKATGLDETPLERFVFDFEWLCDDSAFSTGEDFLCVCSPSQPSLENHTLT